MSALRFDAIVVGSGIGGLAAARALSWTGRRVLVLEQHDRPGGMTHEFGRNGRFRFSTGVHYIGAGNRVADPLQQLAALTDGAVQWSPLPDAFDRLFFPGVEVAVPSTLERYAEQLQSRFPDEREAIAEYCQDALAAARGLSRILATKVAPPWLAPWLREAIARASPLTAERTDDYLKRRFRSPMLRAILAAQWGDYGIPPSGSAFGYHALIGTMHYADGAVYPVGGSEVIARAIVAGLESAGSEVRTGWRVQQIVVEAGRAVGVLATDPKSRAVTRIDAPAVVSDAGVLNTFGHLLPATERPAFAAELRALPRNPTGMVLFLGLDRSPADFGADGGNHWLFPDTDHDAVARASPGEGLLYVSFPSLKNPAATEHTIEVVTIGGMEAFQPYRSEPWPRSDADYRALKERISNRMLERLELHLPGLRDAVVHAELATPLTFETFQASVDGAFYGLACSPERLRSRLAGPRTPIGGLYLAGQDAGTPGVQGALVGGLLAATAVVRPRERLRLWKRVRGYRPETSGTFRGHLRVVDVRDESPTVKSFVLEALDGGPLPLRFEPGQFVTLHAEVAGERLSRSYSISSAPDPQRCTLTIKRQHEGRVSGFLHRKLLPGRAIEVEGPYGHFSPEDGSVPLILVGGGVGLTPLMSIFRARRGNVRVVLSAQRNESELLFHEELSRVWGGEYLPIVEEAQEHWQGSRGRISQAVLEDLVLTHPEAHYYVCGPSPMMDAVRTLLRGLGVDPKTIRTESFSPQDTSVLGAAAAVVQLQFQRAGRTVRAQPGQTLLAVAQQHGVALKAACGAGQCGVCRVRVVEGETSSVDRGLLDPDERKAGFVLACQTVPLSDVVLDA